METFPTSILSSYPLPLETEFKTLVTDFESGKEQRRKRWAFPKRSVGLRFDSLSPDGFKTLWEFYQARSGAYEAFNYIHPIADYWYGEKLGVGNGSQTTFDLPGVETAETSVVVYKDGVSSAFTWVSGGGEAGSDRVTMSTVPAPGAVLTADFYGRLRIVARFAQDKLGKELFEYLLYRSEIRLAEVR